MVVVSSSTPLIALSKIGLFELLKEYFGKITIPNEVYEEVVTRGSNLFGAREVSNAKEKNALLLIDDRDGRTMAANFGIRITGTVGLLKLFAEDGRIELKKTLDELMASGFRLSLKEYEKIIKDV